MKKKIKSIIIFTLIITLILTFFAPGFVNKSNYKLSVKKQTELKSPLNTTIDVGEDVYVQHDENNKDVYLLSSEGAETTVYKILNIKYTADKVWTMKGRYIDDFDHKDCATAPDDYISVTEGETYFARLYGMSGYTYEHDGIFDFVTPILFLDDENNVVGEALRGTYTDSKKGVEFTIPAGATRMHITNFNNQDITIQKKIIMNEQEFNVLKNKQDEIINSLESNYENVKNDPILIDQPDKCYIIFCVDDSRISVDQYADLFISKNVPLCLASISDGLLNMASNYTETRLDVALRVQEHGGEILVHNAPVVTSETVNDNNFMYQHFVGEKQKFNAMGLETNGIILAGGQGQIPGNSETAKWAYSLYKYSDLYGEQYNDMPGYNSAYYNGRDWLGNYKNKDDELKAYIDDLVENKKYKSFFFHDPNEYTVEDLSNLLDYIKSIGTDKVEIVTYKTLYDKFAKRESDIINNLYEGKTYYVSSNGTSTDGTNINDPINLETLNNKEIKSGDTVLFKKGDTFFGKIDFSVSDINDKKVTISSYGTGDLPTICSYKYISNNWEQYSDNIYRIDIKDTNNFTGYKSDAGNAFNVGFMEDDSGNKYYNKKDSIDALSNEYDFYSDGSQYLYMYTNTNPYDELGNLKVVVRNELLQLKSNMEVSNIRFAYSAGHAIVGSDTNEENIKINNCIIENIGGSYLFDSDTTRYGNGIEFYKSNAKNIEIYNNIFRDIYDVAFTIQGNAGSGTDILVHDNVFVGNAQDSEIGETSPATGVNNYQFYDNISINQGRGWGYDARPDKDYAAHILFWEYHIDPTDIYFHNNMVYNPRRVYFIERTKGTKPFFKDNDYIKSDYNAYYMASDAKIYDQSYSVGEKKEFIEEYNKDKNSTFQLIDVDESKVNLANSSDDINEIRTRFEKDKYLMNINEPKWTFLPVSQTRALDTLFNPTDVTDEKTVTWSSSNTDIATVDSDTGKITAKGEGTTTITSSDGEMLGTYTLNVKGILGDYDNDSQITAYDAYKALLLSVNQGTEDQINEDDVVTLDVDRDETVTAWDAYRILTYSIGLISEF